MAADLVVKQFDTFPALRGLAKDIVFDPVTGLPKVNGKGEREEEPIDFATAIKAMLNLKWQKSGLAAIERAVTAPGGGSIKTSTGGSSGLWEFQWQQNDLNPTALPDILLVELEIEWPETGGVKRYQTVPNAGYRTIECVADLGIN
jgi:hypothetical protein